MSAPAHINPNSASANVVRRKINNYSLNNQNKFKFLSDFQNHHILCKILEFYSIYFPLKRADRMPRRVRYFATVRRATL